MFILSWTLQLPTGTIPRRSMSGRIKRTMIAMDRMNPECPYSDLTATTDLVLKEEPEEEEEEEEEDDDGSENDDDSDEGYSE
jgi:hypothetical protein